MTRYAHTTLVACAAFVLALGSMGAIATVPPAQAETPAAIDLPEVA